MKKNKWQCALLFACSIAMSACANLMTTYEPEHIPLPDNFLAEGGSASIDNAKWWQSFNSAELNSIQELALTSLDNENKRQGNYDLQIAFTRLNQSRALRSQSRSVFFPSISYRGSTDYVNNSNDSQSSKAYEETDYTANFSLSYELDLWGKFTAQAQAIDYDYQASYEDVLTTVLSISSSITDDYIDLLSTRKELAILQEQVKLNEAMVKIQEVRYLNGQSSSLDVLQQKEQYLQSKADEPLLIERQRALLASLALLTGNLPTYELEVNEKELPILPPLPKTGLPADLLHNRPDIRAAKLRLQAEDKNLSAAKLAYFPSITLSVTELANSMDITTLLDDWIATVVGTVSGVLFDGGAKSAEAQRQDAVAQEAAINYVKTVSVALDEVNTALMAEDAQKKYLAILKEQFVYETAALQEAETSYLFGAGDFLRYITQLQNLQTLERTLIREEAELLKLRVDLYKSLGIKI